MEANEVKWKVAELIEAWEKGTLSRNPEYQRGAAWNAIQRPAFIDSLFREYPLPAFFFHKIVDRFRGEISRKYEIVDGQQRLMALRDFHAGRYKLLTTGEKSKLRVPKSVREKNAPWAGKSYNELETGLQQKFEDFEVTVFEITSAEPDEIRDLFIRLQSGTALTRQQVRDAWPDNIGPFVEKLAGKLDKRPIIPLFSLMDKREAKK